MATKTIPTASRKVLRAQAKPSILQRAKSALKRAAGAIKRTAKTVVAKAKAAAKIAWSKTATAWRKALRPLLKTFGVVVAACIWVSVLVAAPLGTLLLTAGVGLLFISTARLIEALEASDHRAAKAALLVFEAIAMTLRAAFYAWSALVAIATFPAWGPIAGIFTAVYIVLKALPRSEQMFETPPQVAVEPDFETPAIKRRQKIAVVEAEVVETLVAKPKTIRAVGAEEMFDTPACAACGTIEGQLRAKSHRRAADLDTEAWVCSECYDLECEDDAIRFTGVSLKKMSTEVRLNKAGLEATAECAASQADDNVHWAPTAWWRDKNGTLHEREWSGFVKGEVVANVVFDYRRGTYRTLVMGKPPRNAGAQRDRQAAQRLATDLWNDAVLRLEHEMQETAPRRAVKAV